MTAPLATDESGMILDRAGGAGNMPAARSVQEYAQVA
jgi:hypothetical protein